MIGDRSGRDVCEGTASRAGASCAGKSPGDAAIGRIILHSNGKGQGLRDLNARASRGERDADGRLRRLRMDHARTGVQPNAGEYEGGEQRCTAKPTSNGDQCNPLSQEESPFCVEHVGAR